LVCSPLISLRPEWSPCWGYVVAIRWQEAEITLTPERAHKVHVDALPALKGHHRLADLRPARGQVGRWGLLAVGLAGQQLVQAGVGMPASLVDELEAEGLDRLVVLAGAAAHGALANPTAGTIGVDAQPAAVVADTQPEWQVMGTQRTVGVAQGAVGLEHGARTFRGGFPSLWPIDPTSAEGMTRCLGV